MFLRQGSSLGPGLLHLPGLAGETQGPPVSTSPELQIHNFKTWLLGDEIDPHASIFTNLVIFTNLAVSLAPVSSL